MQMRSSIVHFVEPQQAKQDMAITCMDKELFKAAATGDMKLFNKYEGDFQCLVDKWGNTALHIYFRIGLEKKYKRFLYFWVERRSKSELNMNFVQKLVDKCPSLLQQPNEKGEIPLHIVAAKVGISEVVKFIIERNQLLQNEDSEKGLEPTNRMIQMLSMTDKNGNTALHKAAECDEAECDEDNVVRLLLKELDPNDSLFSAKNRKGETPLYLAAKEGNHFSVDAILDKCKSTAHGGPEGRTALHAAILGGRIGRSSRGNERTLRKLIEANNKLIRETDDKGRTSLHYAAHFGDRSAVKLLLEADASAAYITDTERGTTALHMAAWQGHQDIMEEIISYCPDCCEIVDKKYGWNFLHFAFVTLNADKLLKSVVDPESKMKDLLSEEFLLEKDINGNSPLDVLFFLEFYTQRARHFYAIDFLERRGYETKSCYLNIHYEERKEKVGEKLKEIGKNAEVAGKQVHSSFRDIMKDNGIKDLNKIRETHLVVATLVATVTFTAGIAVPGGYNSESNGIASLSHNSAFKAFIITDALAFITSLFAIFLHFLSVYFEEIIVLFSGTLVLVADCLTIFAMAEMLVAFSTGTYAALESSLGAAIVTCSLAPISFFCVSIAPFLLYFMGAYLNLPYVRTYMYNHRPSKGCVSFTRSSSYLGNKQAAVTSTLQLQAPQALCTPGLHD
ncbi:hypothetical protein DITRI_Ditri15bG0032100 [Diplodiscus trichospermus]